MIPSTKTRAEGMVSVIVVKIVLRRKHGFGEKAIHNGQRKVLRKVRRKIHKKAGSVAVGIL